jgi:Asp-tRNA(Asn)/Glu-tRNA(Gln) amidotransferase A subunit family amidase
MHTMNIDTIKKTWLASIDNALSGEAYFELVQALLQHREKTQAVFDSNKIEVLAYPTSKVPNTPNDGGNVIVTEGPLGEMLSEMAIGENMMFAPSTRRPSIAMFSGLDKAGLPLSVTFDGNSGDDRRLLDIAEVLETALPPLAEPGSI